MVEGRAGRVPRVLLPSAWSIAVLRGLAVLVAGATILLASQAGRADGAARVALLAGAALCAAGGMALGIARERDDRGRVATAEQVAVEAETGLAAALAGALAPITSYLGEMADARLGAERAIIAGELRQAVVEAAVRLTAPVGRAAYYSADLEAGLLERAVWAGHAVPPRSAFVSGTADGDAVLDLVERGDLVAIDDVTADPMVTPSHPGTYRAVVAAAVTAGSQRLGVLTVDAPGPATFGPADVELVRVLANLLGTGLAQAGGHYR